MAAVTNNNNNNNKESKLLRSTSTITLTQSEKGPLWTIKSLLQMPSPICSSSSTTTIPTPYSSPSTELFLALGPTESASPLLIKNPDDHLDFGKQPPSTALIHEWIQNTTNFRALTGIHEIPSAKEAGIVREDDIQEHMYKPSYGPTAAWNLNEGRDDEDRGQERDKLTSRPKPYERFLEEVKTQQIEAEILAWRRTKHEQLMNKLTRKEAAIGDWEFRETMKALKERKKLEGKLERNRTKVLKMTQERISKAKEVANKKRAKARVSTVKKISKITKLSENQQTTRKSVWLLKLKKLIHK
ncbi:hypothetical protein ACFE04_026411 [Oxalis oulophora]